MSENAANPGQEKKCPQCGAVLPAGALSGLCPACLLKQAATETATQPHPQKFHPPTVEELARLFPQLEILSLIGRGGMGAVYKARQPQLDRIVALKILPSQVTHGTDFGDRFTREARALAKLNHPNIVMVYDFGQASGQPYFIMEYVDGLNLRQLEQEGKLSPREALQIVPQICEALQFAHDAGIVHRDIKPDNILLDKRGRVKIADFGIAKILGATEAPGIPVTQGAIGTPHYMAPEQVEKPQTVDHRADIYSLGVVFYEMLTGELPLGKFAPPSSGPRGVQVDVRLDEVVLRALERKPELRFQHASQVKTAVETIAGTQAGAAAATFPSGQIPPDLLARDYPLQIRHCLRRGWNLLKSDFWPLVGVTALILALLEIATVTLDQLGNAAKGTSLGFGVFQSLLTGPMVAGLCLYFLKKIRREPATVETAFAGFTKRFLHLFLGNLVMSVLIVLGFIFFIVPGIYLMVAYAFVFPLIIDKGLDFWPAMELSRKMVHKHWWKMLLFYLVVLGLWIVGALCCVVGLLIALPLTFAASLYLYEDVFGARLAVNPPRRETVRVTPQPQGPEGTMVMPNAGGSGTPPGAGSPPAAASGGNLEPVQTSHSWLFPVILLMLVGGFLAAVGIGIAVYEKQWNKSHASRTSVSSPVAPVVPAAPEPPELASPVFGSTPTRKTENAAYDSFVDRIRQELGKISVSFDGLQITNQSESNLVVNFAGLRKLSPGVTNAAAAGGIQVSNEEAEVSVSLANGIHIKDKKNPNKTTVSLPFLRISVNEDEEDSGQPIEGTLTGSRQGDFDWRFEGTGKLADVKFEMDGLDLNAVLAPPKPPAKTHETFSDRLEAASTIADTTTRDKALRTLAADAARAGDVEIVKSALGGMVDMEERDAATHDAALQLAQDGLRKDAIELAKGIADPDIRDQVMTALASDPKLFRPKKP